MPGPLEGYSVIDLCRAGPGRHATGILADYGAQVISIVQPGYAQISAPGEGGLRRGDTVNPRNKRSLFLNMRADGALEVFMRLVKQSDALLESNRPGAAQRLGIDYESVKKTNPNIVYCSLTGFGQTGPKVGSFDGGWGASYMARIIGQKRAREIWFLCRFYDAKKALSWGLINEVVPYKNLEEETVMWSKEILEKSPFAIRMLKGALNADCDGQAGLQQLAGDATMLFYMSEEAKEGREKIISPFLKGDPVKIIAGPFIDFNGVIPITPNPVIL